MEDSSRSFALVCWNVRGLGDVLVKNNLSDNIASFKCASFLPPQFDSVAQLDAISSAGGLLIAWNSRMFRCTNQIISNRSISIQFSSELSDINFWATNVYGPTAVEEQDEFFQDLMDINQSISGPWILAGDFNIVRSVDDRNYGNASFSETYKFGNLLRDIQVQEIPLTDRNFTWSNMQEVPILTRIDRCFINADWDSVLPNSMLRSLPRTTSDHFPLCLEASTSIP
ncbi:hypothetical protein BRADI_3g36433v3, partial [Brachypodium distachyon]